MSTFCSRDSHPTTAGHRLVCARDARSDPRLTTLCTAIPGVSFVVRPPPPPSDGNHYIDCYSCPLGGACNSLGAVTASPGYWGGGLPRVTFVVCPVGYCCTGDDTWPCNSISACAGFRRGALCGACADGYVEAVGTVSCVPVEQCDRDLPLFWTLLALGVGVAAAIQLAVVSDVWCPSRNFPKGKLKLMIYFFQVCTVVCVTVLGASACCCHSGSYRLVFMEFPAMPPLSPSLSSASQRHSLLPYLPVSLFPSR